MNSTGIIDKIPIYGISIPILIVFITILIFRIIKRRAKRGVEQTELTEGKAVSKSSNNIPDRTVTPQRRLSNSEIKTEIKNENTVLNRIEQMRPLKRGIIWAEILGRPGGRIRRNT